MNADLIWETVTSYCSEPDTNYPENISRAKVPGGWLLCGQIDKTPVMVFIPDMWYSWKLSGNNVSKT